MSSFTAVDLSRLPMPEVIEQIDYETLLTAMRAELQARLPGFDAWLESDPIVKLLEVAAYREMGLRQQFNDRARSVMLAYALGADLDHLGALFGVKRRLLDPGDPAKQQPARYENDVDFRRRITLAPKRLSVAGPEGAYIYHALGAHADVLDASVASPAPGQVQVHVLSRHGDGSADTALLTAVNSALNADHVRPLTDQVTVASAQIVAYEIEASITTYAGPDASVVLAQSQQRVKAYVAEHHRLGRDVTCSALFAALHSEGVQRVILHQPATDLLLNRQQAAFCTGITLNYAGTDE